MAGPRVFLSSTAHDLAAYRKVADDTLLRLQAQSVIMERFGPLPGRPVDECERLATECDVLICIVAHRYGYEPEPGRGSITRREVEAAHGAGKPVYAWIVDDTQPWTEAKEQDRLTDPAVLGDPVQVQALASSVRVLQDFKAWLRNNVVVDSFTTPDDLGRKIATTLANVSAPTVSRPVAPPELRIVHALQPAPYFEGREALVDRLFDWVLDTASPDRVHALVAIGGTGKTAVAEAVLQRLRARWPVPGAGSVLVWSFYERPDADAFLRACAHLFLGESDDAPAGGRLERLQRGLADGRPHLVVLDGLERAQRDAGGGTIRGELDDHQLKLLLQAIASGLGRTRALVTSRFPLVDLHSWRLRGLVETPLDDLPLPAARAVLRGWGVVGADLALDAVAESVGRHALSVAVIGSYLQHFEGGRVEGAARFKLDDVVGDDVLARKLAKVLAFYAEKLPTPERDLLARMSVFPRGITLEILHVLVDAGRKVAGVLVKAKPELPRLLQRLVDRGLVFSYVATDRTVTWTAHPFVRERFSGLLGCPSERVFDAVASQLGQGLELRPEQKPMDSVMLDRYEQLIELMRLAGRTQEAFDLYWFGLGGFAHLGRLHGDYARGYRILRGFLPANGAPAAFGAGLAADDQSVGLNDLALYAQVLGKLGEAADLLREADASLRLLGEPDQSSSGLQNTCEVAFARGRLLEARDAANEALTEAVRAEDPTQRKYAFAFRASANHLFGELSSAVSDFTAAAALEAALEDERLLYSLRGLQHARHHLDQGAITAARAIVTAGLPIARRNRWHHEHPRWHALLARLALHDGADPAEHLAEIRDWTARTGDMSLIIEAHALAARAALARGDLTTALSEATDGARLAQTTGFRLLEIENLLALSAVHLALPNPNAALTTAREALDLATAPECGYAWGEADAAHAWGLAFERLHQYAFARRAFTQALAVRESLGHPGLVATRDALARVGGISS
ncbi:MAG: DUF4062 domain-containing protein [Myxococcales bacterium]|nr:DUF4062 domain-containing protein [Myxococcales bacterium]